MVKRASMKKMKELVKTELLDSVMENNEMDEPELEEQANSITELTEAIAVINRLEDIIRTQNKKVINFVGSKANH